MPSRHVFILLDHRRNGVFHFLVISREAYLDFNQRKQELEAVLRENSHLAFVTPNSKQFGSMAQKCREIVALTHVIVDKG